MRSEVQRLPALFLERFRLLVGSQKFDELANTFAEPKPTTFRVNTLKAGAQFIQLLAERLQHQGFRLEKVPWYSEAFILRAGRLRDLQETEAYQKGEIYVQSLSSMLPPLLLDPRPGETVLDLTAAPGSKTTQLACLMKGEGRIVANDNNKIRFFKLRANVELQGAANVELSMKPGELFGRDFPEHFDRVLVDAPCTAEGRFLVAEPASYKYWKPAKIKEMARKQKNLILSGLRVLKPGGVLVYSTCTFAPEENEAVLTWALGKMPTLQVEKIHLSFPNQTAGLTRWEGEEFHPAVRAAVRVIPTSLMEGFFLARIRKK
jgi:16S rRNA (cytosine1407-C5)-methyltransferase